MAFDRSRGPATEHAWQAPSRPLAEPGAAPLPREVGAGTRRPIGILLLYPLAYAGGVIGYLPLLTLLLPLKIETLAGESRLEVLSATVIAGALAASLSNILFGWLSDRSVARGGGRRGWLAGGIVATAISYAAIAAASSPVAIVLAIVLFQLAVNALLAPLLAIMADEVPDGQKGLAGGLLAFANPLASALSTALMGAALLGEDERLLAVPLCTALCVVPLLLSRIGPAAGDEEAPAPQDARRRDLLIAGGARLLVQVAGNALALYLLYYFESVSPGQPERELAKGVGHLLTLAYLLPLPVAVLAGRLSDRLKRRKPFLLGSAVVAAAGLCGMGIARSWAGGAFGFVLYALGSSVFLALHAGFAMQLLPSPRHRGRDLGFLNLTNTLPALLGPLLTWLLATPRDFTTLMMLLSALTIGGGILILAARGRPSLGEAHSAG